MQGTSSLMLSAEQFTTVMYISFSSPASRRSPEFVLHVPAWPALSHLTLREVVKIKRGIDLIDLMAYMCDSSLLRVTPGEVLCALKLPAEV